MNLTPDEQKLLLEVAAILTPDTLNGIYHSTIWFEPEEEEKIRQAHALAIKIGKA